MSAALILGPEGDLTPEEVSAACAAGFIPVDMGPRVLRADTAPIALVTMIQATLGDMA
jgi:16S rRNA (uracil1498-N3)-methyltransferase